MTDLLAMYIGYVVLVTGGLLLAVLLVGGSANFIYRRGSHALAFYDYLLFHGWGPFKGKSIVERAKAVLACQDDEETVRTRPGPHPATPSEGPPR